ncbi:hypothetical protein CfE428DRAFT_4796 [Chthoniobacter flavus Ellin428]|uniref:Phosphate-selective porin O and P n=1 Tax=Chthoniobacter flavus Ellin428 TaxID=497964 RepID=B4D7A6_9BACT|nr:hypothetical protein [Chthoniobacter flavus]EDY17757.1 hypothetical protein CfE428DRAFT_4796 [Chthoniobacter flavus Ellin428]TCO87082.1 hypothetical protein EV701_12459 [Chthoniobacter flavus]
MKIARTFLYLLLAATVEARAQSIIEQLDNALTFSAFDGSCRVRLSGLVDLEAYHLEQPAPALIDTDRHALFNPRLSLFLDAQFGSHVYAFAQSRVDRGFDPSDSGGRMRLDEYAVRVTPWDDGRFNVQAGKFSTVVGNWAPRHDSWENPFINAPLPYENPTGVWDSMVPEETYDLLQWSHVNATDKPQDVYADKYLRNPIIWGPSYATGMSVFGALGKFDYAAEIKNSALSSRPEAWNITDVGFSHPTYSGRLGWRPDEMWKFGISASVGPYLMPSAASTVPPGHGFGDYREILLGQDIRFAWHHFQLWAEFFEVRFDIPGIAHADTFSYYIEGRYQITPQFFAALRWNQQLFGSIRNDDNELQRWGRDAARIDIALGYRFTEYTQLKLQYSLLREDPAQNRYNNLFAVQFTLRF